MARRSTLTQRDRECQKIARSKAARKRMQLWKRRGYIALGVAAGLAVLSAGLWEYRSAGVSRTAERIADAGYGATARAGFSLRTLSLEGRRRTPLAAVKQALGVQAGEPILAVNLDNLRTRLEQLPTVKQARVQRLLPGTLQVTLIERQPVAVWQLSGHLHLIDDEGAVMDDLVLQDFPNLPLLVGEGAPQHVSEALAIRAAAPELAGRVNALIRIGDRRWNLQLASGPEIKLPEENATAAWTQFAAQAHARGLLSEPLREVDLRLPGRIVVQPAPAPSPPRRDGTDA